jgi:hypothetical protein
MSKRAAIAAEILYGVSVVLATLACLYGWSAFNWYRSNALGFVIGAVAGGIAIFFLRPSVVRLFASAENPRKSTAAMLSCVAVLVAGFVSGGLFHLNGALDASQGVVRRGVVTSVSSGGRGAGYRARVRWSDGETSDVGVTYGTPEGVNMTQVLHPGALGWSWEEPPVIRRQ